MANTITVSASDKVFEKMQKESKNWIQKEYKLILESLQVVAGCGNDIIETLEKKEI